MATELVKFKQLNAKDLTTTIAVMYTLGTTGEATATQVQINSIRVVNRTANTATVTVWAKETGVPADDVANEKYYYEYQATVPPKQSIELITEKKIAFSTAGSSTISAKASANSTLNLIVSGMEIYT